MGQEISLDEAIKRGFKAFNEGKLNESHSFFLSVLKSNSGIVSANYGIGLILKRVGKHQEALSFFSICHRSEPKNIVFFQEYIKSLILLGS